MAFISGGLSKFSKIRVDARGNLHARAVFERPIKPGCCELRLLNLLSLLLSRRGDGSGL